MQYLAHAFNDNTIRFVLRYPEGKKAVTGHVFEPWHFRYVGVEAAMFMAENDLTLEEFLDLYRADGGGV